MTELLQDDHGSPWVAVTVLLTFDEFRRANRYLRAKISGYWQWPWKVFAVLVLGNVFHRFLTEDMDNTKWAGYVCSSVFFLVVVYWLLSPLRAAWSDSKRWRKNGEFREPHTYIFSPNRVQIASSKGTAVMSWKTLSAAVRTGSIVLLTDIGGYSYLIPLRAFETAVDQRIFQQLVEAMVPKCRL